MPDYHGYLIKQAYRDDPYAQEYTRLQRQLAKMEQRVELEKQRRLEGNKLILKTNPSMLKAIERDIEIARETQGRGRLRKWFGQAQESPWSVAAGQAGSGAVVGALGGGFMGSMLAGRPGLGALVGAPLGALSLGAAGYGQPRKARARLVGVGEGLHGFESTHEQLPEEGLDPGDRFGPFSEEHQALARKLVSQLPS